MMSEPTNKELAFCCITNKYYCNAIGCGKSFKTLIELEEHRKICKKYKRWKSSSSYNKRID